MTKEELLDTVNWLRVKKLSPNPSKTEYIVTGHPRKLTELGTIPSLELNECEIKRMTKTASNKVSWSLTEGLGWKDQYKSLLGN